MYAKYIKRLLDIVLSLFALLVLGIPMLIVALLIRLDMGSPVIFKQARIGKDNKEFKLLKMLITKAGVTIGREELFREVWGESYMGETRTLDIHISQLRDKITECGGGDVIVTVRGIGYRFDTK